MNKYPSTIKLCWETLEHLILMPGKDSPVLKYYENVEERINCLGEFNESETPCIECKNDFLIKKNSKSKFCSKECKKLYYNKKNQKGPDLRLKENGGGWYYNPTNTPVCSGWNKGSKTGIPETCGRYDNYSPKINWFTETRPDPDDNRILQVKCCICNGWFSPDIKRVQRVIDYVNGISRKEIWGLYCSDECKNKCPYFGKSVKTIMHQDYMNGPSAPYTVRHNISDKVLYYDWQEELKKYLDRIRRPYEKRKLRRRKKTELEKQRMAKKRRKKKEREEYLKSNQYKKDQHLKRMLYATRARAKNKNMENTLDFKWVTEEITKKCPKCGIEFRYDSEIKMDPWAPSIDRTDSNKGYTKDNCVIVSWMYNCGKNCYNEDILYNICLAFLKHNDHDVLTKCD